MLATYVMYNMIYCYYEYNYFCYEDYILYNILYIICQTDGISLN